MNLKTKEPCDYCSPQDKNVAAIPIYKADGTWAGFIYLDDQHKFGVKLMGGAELKSEEPAKFCFECRRRLSND